MQTENTTAIAEKIRCPECANILGFMYKPLRGGIISIKCHHRKPNGKRCGTVAVIDSSGVKKIY